MDNTSGRTLNTGARSIEPDPFGRDESFGIGEPIVLSERDYDLFIELITANTEPPEVARREAAEFKRERAGKSGN